VGVEIGQEGRHVIVFQRLGKAVRLLHQVAATAPSTRREVAE
jgi:hypothetical protein